MEGKGKHKGKEWIIDKSKITRVGQWVPNDWLAKMRKIDINTNNTFLELAKVYLKHHYPNDEFKIPYIRGKRRETTRSKQQVH